MRTTKDLEATKGQRIIQKKIELETLHPTPLFTHKRDGARTQRARHFRIQALCTAECRMGDVDHVGSKHDHSYKKARRDIKGEKTKTNQT